MYEVRVSVTDDGNGELKADVEMVDGSIKFSNSYEAKPTEVQLTGTKELFGQDLRDEHFNFEVIEIVDNEEVGVVATGTNDARGNINFTPIGYSTTGTHEYVVREIDESLGGVSYDASEFHVTIEVTDNGKGQLEANVVYEEPIEFNNTYETTPTKVTLMGTKELTGQAMRDEHFNFEVVEMVDGNEVTVATGTNDATGKINFTSIEYTTSGTHEYVVREVNEGLGGVNYDGTNFHVTVDVTDNGGGQLEANVTYEAPIEFSNEYVPAPTEVTLTGSKELIGQTLRDDQFTFEVVEEIDGEEVEAATGANTADGEIIFSPITYTEIGEHTYTVREVKGTQGGITYDDETYTVVVMVTDDGEGQLHATVDYVDGPISFTNAYEAAPAEVVLEAEKQMTGRDMAEGEFEFELVDNEGTVIDRASNNADGKIVFEALNYTEIGEYKYTIREVKGAQGGITYDETPYTVVITVTDDGEGQLHATANYGEEGSITFRNFYETAPDSIVLEAEKHLSGRDLVNGEFEFELVDNEGTVIDRASNNADGKVYFSEMNYTEAGTYTYTIREVKGELEGVTYDANEFTVVVTVVDDGEGQLTASSESVDGLVQFENTYTEPEEPTDPEGPVDPENPTDPVDPVDPDDPTDPVDTDTFDKDDKDLPKTGEAVTYTGLAILLVVVGLGLRFYYRRRTN